MIPGLQILSQLRLSLIGLFLASSFVVPVTTTQGGDWPGILGPNRSGVANDEQLADNWPKKGPPVLWQKKVGSGFAGAAIVAGRAIVFHRIGDHDIADALDLNNGKPLWQAKFRTRYVPTISSDDGPRCVPVIHDDAVYLYGAGGDLHCVALSDGAMRWSRRIRKDYRAPDGYFGAGSTPIVEGNRLIINVGGARQGAGLVAVSLKTGKTLWKATDESASYSSPVAVTRDGVRHVVFVTRYHLLSVDPASGDVRFKIPFGKRGPTVNAANPVLIGPHVFVTSSYGTGSLLAKIKAKEGAAVWRDEEILASQYTTAVLHEKFLYSIDGRQDGAPGRLKCIDPLKKTVRWTVSGFGIGSLILADGKLLIVKTDGHLVLASPLPTKYQQLTEARITTDKLRALPALSKGRLLIRDTKRLYCVGVGAR